MNWQVLVDLIANISIWAIHHIGQICDNQNTSEYFASSETKSPCWSFLFHLSMCRNLWVGCTFSFYLKLSRTSTLYWTIHIIHNITVATCAVLHCLYQETKDYICFYYFRSSIHPLLGFSGGSILILENTYMLFKSFIYCKSRKHTFFVCNGSNSNTK